MQRYENTDEKVSEGAQISYDPIRVGISGEHQLKFNTQMERKSAYRQDGVLWGSYLHAREEPQRMPRRDAASGQHRGAAGQPYVRLHCSDGNRETS